MSLTFSLLSTAEDFVWSYFGFTAILLFGAYFSIRSRFYQLRGFWASLRFFISFFTRSGNSKEPSRGVHPLKAFFASLGGCIGIGNIVGICTAIQIGGPGSLFWVWVTAIIGMILKYVEVFLGMKTRIAHKDGGYEGGPMRFLQKAYRVRWVPFVVALFLGIYGVEVFQFSVVVSSISANFSLPLPLVVLGFLGLVLYAAIGGTRRVGNIASTIVPFFVVVYLLMSSVVLIAYASEIPSALALIFRSAFTPPAAIGGFVGATLLSTISQGIRAGSYTGDVGIGYASVIHAESQETSAQKQASLTFLGIFIDTFLVSTASVLLIVVTGVWNQGVAPELLVQMALSTQFSHVHLFMPLFIFLLGYSTINAYFLVGLKCAEFVSPKRGRLIYFIYGIFSLIVFSFRGTAEALSLMYLTGGLLVVINCIGFFLLRKEVAFDEKEAELHLAEPL